MGTTKISLSCGVVVIVRVVVMPSNQAEKSKILRHLALAAVFQFKIPRPYIVRNFLKPATASRLLKPSNQVRWTLNNSQTVWRVSSMSELSFLCTELLSYKGIVHANRLMILIGWINDDGDALIKFEAWKRRLWVFKRNLKKLKKVPSVCTQPSRS